MQQDIPQLLADILHILLHDRVAQLVRLLDRVRAQRLERLLLVPWALQPQLVHHVQQALERLQLFFRRIHKQILNKNDSQQQRHASLPHGIPLLPDLTQRAHVQGDERKDHIIQQDG